MYTSPTTFTPMKYLEHSKTHSCFIFIDIVLMTDEVTLNLQPVIQITVI